MLAYDFPVLGAFLTMIWFFLWIVWIILLFRTIADIFRSDDLGGVGKAAWLILLILLPYVGVFTYVIIRGGRMGRRETEHARAREEDFKHYIQDLASNGSRSNADELTKLADLRDRGVIDDAEFQQQKTKILA